MSTILTVLLGLLLLLAIILIGIQVNNTINEQPNLIVKTLKENFTTPVAAWNDAASYTNGNNYLLTTSQNAKFKTEPGYVAGKNQARDVLPFNQLSSTKMYLPDKNSRTGYRNSVAFPGPINPPATVKDIKIDGANVKTDKVVYKDEEAADVQKSNVVSEDAASNGGLIQNFSVNPRVNASAARNVLMSNGKIRKISKGKQ